MRYYIVGCVIILSTAFSGLVFFTRAFNTPREHNWEPSEILIACTNPDALYRVSLATGEKSHIETSCGGRYTCVAASRKLGKILLGTYDASAEIRNNEYLNNYGRIYAIDISDGYSSILYETGRTRIFLNSEGRTASGAHFPTDIVIDDTLGRMLWAEFHRAALLSSDLDGLDLTINVEADAQVRCIDFDLDQDRLYWLGLDNHLRMKDLGMNGKESLFLDFNENVRSFAFDFVRNRIFVLQGSTLRFGSLSGNGRILWEDVGGNCLVLDGYRGSPNLCVNQSSGVVFFDNGRGTGICSYDPRSQEVDRVLVWEEGRIVDFTLF